MTFTWIDYLKWFATVILFVCAILSLARPREYRRTRMTLLLISGSIFAVAAVNSLSHILQS